MDNNECLASIYDKNSWQTQPINGIVWRHEPNGNWFIAGEYKMHNKKTPVDLKELVKSVEYGSGVVSSPIKTNPDAKAIKDYYDKRHPTIWRG